MMEIKQLFTCTYIDNNVFYLFSYWTYNRAPKNVRAANTYQMWQLKQSAGRASIVSTVNSENDAP